MAEFQNENQNQAQNFLSNTDLKHRIVYRELPFYRVLITWFDYIKPDFVHVMQNSKIIKTGNAELAKELELKGYEWLK